MQRQSPSSIFLNSVLLFFFIVLFPHSFSLPEIRCVLMVLSLCLGVKCWQKKYEFFLLLRYAFLFIFLFHFNRFLRNYRPYIIRAMYEIAQSHKTQGNLSNHFPENAESFEFLMLCQRRFYSCILSWHSPKIIPCKTRAP